MERLYQNPTEIYFNNPYQLLLSLKIPYQPGLTKVEIDEADDNKDDKAKTKQIGKENKKYISITPEPYTENIRKITSYKNIKKNVQFETVGHALNKSSNYSTTTCESPRSSRKQIRTPLPVLKNNVIYAKNPEIQETRLSSPQSYLPNTSSKVASSNYCLQISGLSRYDSDYSLRELCKGLHIVSLSTSIDNFTGKCKGIAEITVKTSDIGLNKLKTALETKGYSICEQIKSIGKKNNYADLANHSFLNPFIYDRSSKSPLRKHHLESSEDLFGSSPGVGRYYSANKTREKHSFVLNSWNNQGKVPTVPTKVQESNKICNYMRNTISSSRKYKIFN